jgi:hypothetical protein
VDAAFVAASKRKSIAGFGVPGWIVIALPTLDPDLRDLCGGEMRFTGIGQS